MYMCNNNKIKMNGKIKKNIFAGAAICVKVETAKHKFPLHAIIKFYNLDFTSWMGYFVLQI